MRTAVRAIAGLCAAILLTAALQDRPPGVPWEAKPGSLAGKFLVAAPSMNDPNFDHTVVLMVEHDDRGAFGLIVNRPVKSMSAAELRKALIGQSQEPAPATGSVLLHNGGPVARNRGYVIHSAEFSGRRTVRVSEGISVSSSRDVLRAVTEGRGPRKSLVVVGSAGWGPGQLDREMSERWWVISPLNEAILFGPDAETKWQKAFEKRLLDL